MPPPLKELQNLLYRLITAPSGVAEGLAAERALPEGGLAAIVRGDERLSSEERVDIYANMYFYRLLEVLREDYPATARVLGDVNFHNLITGYLLEYRPTEPSVMWAGRHLADFLRDHPLRAEFPFASDLAMLERATIDVFCAADEMPLVLSRMHAIAPERWALVRMRRIAASAILAVEWKVTAVLRAVQESRQWERPAHEPGRVLVWRRNSRVLYRDLEPGEADALAMLQRTVPFGKVCELLAGGLPEHEAAARISRTIAQWLSDGLLVTPERKTPSHPASETPRRNG